MDTATKRLFKRLAKVTNAGMAQIRELEQTGREISRIYEHISAIPDENFSAEDLCFYQDLANAE
jgi:hypothetical protein